MTTYNLAGGCFWCLDAVFRQLRGVESSTCGYIGGSKLTAHYYAVARGITKHAEAVQVHFDESVIPKEIILDIFFLIHDPTSLNQQGADKGTQYRSAMFHENDSQRSEFEAAIERAQKNWTKPIVTEVSTLDEFYKAEPEHQDYFANNPTNGYCSVVIDPKITKAKQEYAKWFASDELPRD
jgi:peptide-methionine (S)-S-oxide reductase